ncbi:MAG: hypothetical protein ACE5EC_07545 [Phycisphaerae bacterium]
MAVQMSPGGLIVVLKGNVVTSLRRIAKVRSMLILEAEGAEKAFEVVRRQHPPVIIIQVGGVIDEVFKFIRLVTTAARPIPLIAAATRHSARLEQAVLREGARFYLPSLRRNVVERLLEAVLNQNRLHAGSRARSAKTDRWPGSTASTGTA